MNKYSVSLKNRELYGCNIPYISSLLDMYDYPWEILPHIAEHIERISRSDEFTEIKPGIYAGKDVRISPLAELIGPAVIGSGTKIGPGCYIRQNVITGPNCNLGNSTELKNCILTESVQAPHYNYIGDSVLGFHAHLGAGAVCSNLKSDGSSVVIHADKDYETSLRKVGAFIGDFAEVGCHCVLNPGTVIGKNSRVYPLCSVRGVIPDNSIYKERNTVIGIK